MRNKKGFTLVEIIVVIAIIGVLAGIIVPSVMRYVRRGKNDYNANLETELVSVAKSYYSEHKEELPRGYINENTNLPITTKLLGVSYLANQNYLLGDFKDADGNNCKTNSYVVVENDDGNYKYTPCVVCDNGYSSDEKSCNYEAPSSSNEGENTPPSCSLTLKSGTVNKWTNQGVVLKLSASDNKGLSYYYLNNDADGITIEDNPLSFEFEKNFNSDTNISSYYAGVIDVSGNYNRCYFNEKILIDKTAPTVDDINFVGDGNVLTIKASDKGGSGLDRVCISANEFKCDWDDSSSFDISSGTYTKSGYNPPNNYTGIIYVFVKDKAGNVSVSTKYTIVKLPTKVVIYNDSKTYFYSSGAPTTVCLQDAIGLNHFTIEREFYTEYQISVSYYYDEAKKAYCFNDKVTLSQPRYTYVYYKAKYNDDYTKSDGSIVSLKASFTNKTKKTYYVGCVYFEQISDYTPKPTWQDKWCDKSKKLYAYNNLNYVDFEGQYLYNYSTEDYVWDITNGAYRFGDQFYYYN